MWSKAQKREIKDLRANIGALTIQMKHQQEMLDKIYKHVGTVIPGLGRVIAKLDPNYGLSEHDPNRRRESDALGQQVIEKLKHEHGARTATEEEFLNR